MTSSSILPVSRASARPGWRVAAWFGWLAPVAIVAAIAGRRWWQFGEFASGLDGGTWLVLGRSLFGGEGRATGGAYPPLVPTLMHLGQAVADPMATATLLAAGSLAAIMGATYLVARRGMDRVFALGVSGMVGLASPMTEALIFGGYPQNLAFAFLLLAAFALARYLAAGHRRHLAWTAAGFVGAALSHHMYFALACAVATLVWGTWLTTGPSRAVVRRRTLAAAAAGVLGVICFAPTLFALRGAGYDPPVNPDELGLGTALSYSIREAPWLLAAHLCRRHPVRRLDPRRRGTATWQVAAALMGVSLLLFPFTAEPRLVPPMIVGASLGFGLTLHELWTLGRDAVWGGFAPTLAVALPLLLWPRADTVAAGYYDFYQQVDRSLVRAAAAVDAHPGEGLVVVREDVRAGGRSDGGSRG